MFTGIIREIGKVTDIGRAGDNFRLKVTSWRVAKGVVTGDSVAVNGACLTVIKSAHGFIEFDIMEETARLSTLTYLNKGDDVNLERAMKAGDALDGHIVQGHIDCVGIVRSAGKDKKGYSIVVEVPDGFEGLYIDKGSVAIDGVSLTVGSVSRKSFGVHIIPHTLKSTTLGIKRAGERVNIEFDVTGKYILGYKTVSAQSKVTDKFLRENGFV
jgi:riboflavin synthase